MSGWQVFIDRGGTFTDVVAIGPTGRRVVHKLLSDDPGRYEDAALRGIRDVMGLVSGEPLPVSAIDVIKMGTTVATNALLERKGERTVLVVDRGFADALRIGLQTRPDLFARAIVLPEPLYERVIEVGGRVTAGGDVLEPLDEEQARADLLAAHSAGIRSVAIALMHGYRYPDHERRLAAIAREVGFGQVSASHEVSPLMKLVGRGDTTVADAWLSPVLRRRVDALAARTGDVRLLFMQSNGGLAAAATFRGKDAVLSGPAGGVVGAVRTSAAAGFDHIIGFDMGGTSTDVCHHAGEYERTFETEVAGVRLRAPMMAVHTVAAGGGSILHFDGARFLVGPDSAGADPGPACYRRGGPLTITDANVLLGKVLPEHFPRVFGPDGDEPIDGDLVRARFAELARTVSGALGREQTPEQVAEGFVAVAVETMARAIRRISIDRGHHLRGYALCSFGGAGGQHACLVADALEVDTVLIHPHAGVLSALGIGLAVQRAFRERSVEAALSDAVVPELERVLAALEADARDELVAQGVSGALVRVVRRAHLRYEGTDTAFVVSYGTPAEMVARFEEEHRRRYGFEPPEWGVVVEALAVEAIAGDEVLDPGWVDDPETALREPIGETTLRVGGEGLPTPVYKRSALPAGTTLVGPAVLVEATGTTVVEPGWGAEVSTRKDLILHRILGREGAGSTTAVDPTLLTVFNHRFMSVAEQMGVTLEHNAHSVNIKERRDYSCAVFDREGRLVANAPHIPVHLGSMGESVRAAIAAHDGAMGPGDVTMLNDPYGGGTHLPDITVVTPVYDEGEAELLFYVASRGHHADVGGTTPGSMPPDSRAIDEEGVLVRCFPLSEGGRFRERAVLELLTGGPHPARNPRQNIADLRAQVAANARGVRELRGLVARFGLETVRAYMEHVRSNAADSVRRLLDRLPDGEMSCLTDEGCVVRVRVSVDKEARRARIDFTGTSPQQETNANAPLAVCKAAVLYVFRTLVDADIPLSSGCLEPLDIVVPEGSLLDPRYPAAVVAGNVETSQTVADTLLGALGAMAASQGTMNNLTFGDETHQYYETLCGGAGAGPGFDGASAVHTHMTNSRLTDPEVLEARFPVLVEAFSVRRGSGGGGVHTGGDGVVRRLRFLAPMTVAILSGRRVVPPHGLAGGEPGMCGSNRVERAGGSVEELGGRARIQVEPGDVLVIETPGGGGYGPPR